MLTTERGRRCTGSPRLRSSIARSISGSGPREKIFAPVGRDVVELWALLNPDEDLKVTGITLAGGTKIRRAGALHLADGDTALPDRKNSAAMLSTGQRNALSLATYLPRATQSASPFGFLILHDPIHAFDTLRVRYLARHPGDSLEVFPGRRVHPRRSPLAGTSILQLRDETPGP